MELTYECPSCEAHARVDAVESAGTVRCACGHERRLNDRATAGGALSACPWCVTDDLYIQKDFPHVLGLAIVIAGFAASTVFWYDYRPAAALGVLLFTAALDLVLFHLVPDVTICYRCLSQFRGRGANPEGRFKPFDLAIGERYRQERIRVEELRRQRTDASPTADPGGP